MKFTQSKQGNRVLLAAVASALALSLTACGERPAGDQVGKNLERNKSPMSADAPQPGLERPGPMAEAGGTLEDAAVTAKVKSALTAEPNLKSLTINVETTSGVVTLKGTADSQDSRQKAEQVASAIEGVRTVKNELVVISG